MTDRPQAHKKFYFVNDKPASNQERTQARSFVRRHVGRWTWEQMKDSSPGSHIIQFDSSSHSGFPSTIPKGDEFRPDDGTGEGEQNLVLLPGARGHFEHAEGRLARVEPQTILQRGNSDPFESLPITVSPQVNRVVSFFREAYLPATYATKTSLYYRSLGRDGQWSDAVSALRVEICGKAFLCAFLTVMARLSPPDALEREVLDIKGQSYKALRAQISNNRDYRDDTSILNCILYLYAAETFAGNFAEASIHGKFLRDYFNEIVRKGKLSSIPLSAVVRAVVYDMTLAQLQMAKPIFTLENWVRELSEQLLSPLCLHPLMPAKSDFINDLDCSPSCEPLKTTFVKLRLIGWCWVQENPPTTDHGDTTTQWILIYTHIIKGELIEYYLALQASIESENISTVVSVNGEKAQLTRCCLILATLCFLTWFGGDPIISGHSVLGVYKTMLTLLDYRISKILGTSAVIERDYLNSEIVLRYRDIYLWILFIGAQSEQKDTRSYPYPLAAPFNTRFRCLARHMSLSTWPMIQERLSRFIYFESVQPYASIWVPASLACID
ncbi:hypothetical protein F5884DRAFT_811286 [Xylogone sp. PMI_703]|nr:hypothetical protein F5884DRAFT_811286 [Xylogone sp. PMI_703]